MIVSLNFILFFCDYLCPACERLQYIGSGNTSGNSCDSVNSKEKCGPIRDCFHLRKNFFRLGLLEWDIAH